MIKIFTFLVVIRMIFGILEQLFNITLTNLIQVICKYINLIDKNLLLTNNNMCFYNIGLFLATWQNSRK